MSAEVVPDRLIDLNVCVGPLPGGDDVAVELPELLDIMDRWGVDHAVIHHTWARFADVVAGNRKAIDIVADQPRLSAGFVVTPLATGEHGSPSEIRSLLGGAYVRLAVAFPMAHGWSLAGLEATSLLGLLSDLGKPLLVSARQTSLAEVAAACAAFPDLPVVLSEVGYRNLRQLVAMFERFANLRCDLSYFAAHDAVEVLVERFGPHILVYGSGLPFCDPAGGVARLRWSGLDPQAARMVAHGNAEAMVGSFVAAGGAR